MNLINNGMEAMPDGGKIKISCSRTTLDEPYKGYEEIPAGEYTCLKVTDEGTGIPANAFTMIFEPFYTNKPTRTKGTGLGMTIIWATVKDHKGFVDISSKEHRGTTFTLYLPATNNAFTGPQQQATAPATTGNETILLVDDLEEQLIIGTYILNNLGYKVVTAKESEEALTILTNQTIDLVILDMIMPGQLDGLETYQEILKLCPKQKTIIASGYSESERVKEMQELGAGSYIQKPYSMDELAQAVRKELDR
jgi:CheY-like chemotaxis protein